MARSIRGDGGGGTLRRPFVMRRYTVSWVSKSGPIWKDRPAKPRSSGAPLPVNSAPMAASMMPSVKSRCTMAKLGPLPLRVLLRRPSCSSVLSSSARQSRPFQWRWDAVTRLVAIGCGTAASARLPAGMTTEPRTVAVEPWIRPRRPNALKGDIDGPLLRFRREEVEGLWRSSIKCLMRERSVTRAAERLGRTQSAVSHSLSRLRDQLGDPLLIKGGRRMETTAFALEFIDRVHPLLRGVERVLSPRHRFEPARSRRVFRLAAPDFALALFTDLLADLRAEAPGVSIEWPGPRETMLLEVAEGQVDIAISPARLRLPAGVVGEDIGALEWRCFASRGHPAFHKWGARAWTRWPHLVVRVGDQLESPVNIAAAAAGLKRTIAGWVPNFSVIP